MFFNRDNNTNTTTGTNNLENIGNNQVIVQTGGVVTFDLTVAELPPVPAITSNFIAAQEIPIYSVVAFNGDGEVVLADITNASQGFRIAGVSIESASVGEELTIVVNGVIENPFWNWQPGLPILLGSTPGSISQFTTDPSIAAFNLYLGKFISPTKLDISIGTPAFLNFDTSIDVALLLPD